METRDWKDLQENLDKEETEETVDQMGILVLRETLA